MIARSKRLALKTFNRKKARTLRSAHLFISYLPNTLSYNRVAVVIAKKDIPGAVVRHRIKRQLLHLAKGWPEKGYDLILIPQGSLVALSSAARRQLLADLVKPLFL